MSEIYDVIIIGGGPAGFSAGIYAGRSGLKGVILEKGYGGGQAATTPLMENYPGFEAISGMELMDRMKSHAQRYVQVIEGAEVVSAKLKGDIFLIETGTQEYMSRAVILATGAEYKKLGIPGEEQLLGRGVSYCATCDGMFFRGKKVAVIGGGNTAATEALHLKHIGADVVLVHRRNALRAERILQDRLKDEKINLLLEREPVEVMGDARVSGLKLRSKSGAAEEILEVRGVFIAIGVKPSTALANQLGVALDESQFIMTDRNMRTNVRFVYAAGDVTSGLRQVITASAKGAIAATSAYEDLRTPYWA